MSLGRAALKAGLFAYHLFHKGESSASAKVSAAATLKELEPITDPVLMALDDIQARRQAKKVPHQHTGKPEPITIDAEWEPVTKPPGTKE